MCGDNIDQDCNGGDLACLDTDGDGVPDISDNCPNVANADQADSDGNGTGDVCETIADIDGNIYNVIKIGNQTWMAENLKTITYNDGTEIQNLTDDLDWANAMNFLGMEGGAYCWYNNDPSYKNVYGALYNWYAVNTGKLCPAGWHVPTSQEWWSLGEYLDFEVAGGKLKETGTAHWSSPNTGASNITGFTALPGGIRSNGGSFLYLGLYGYWLTSVSDGLVVADSFYMFYNFGYLTPNPANIRDGLSVRCLKGN